MNKYLFVDFNNGHEKTYHPFMSDIDLTNEEAKDLQYKYFPGASRMGTHVTGMMHAICEEGFNVNDYIHPEYKVIAHTIVNPNLNEWIVLHGISGNY